MLRQTYTVVYDDFYRYGLVDAEIIFKIKLVGIDEKINKRMSGGTANYVVCSPAMASALAKANFNEMSKHDKKRMALPFRNTFWRNRY